MTPKDQWWLVKGPRYFLPKVARPLRCKIGWHSAWLQCCETIETNKDGHVIVIKRTYSCPWCGKVVRG